MDCVLVTHTHHARAHTHTHTNHTHTHTSTVKEKGKTGDCHSCDVCVVLLCESGVMSSIAVLSGWLRVALFVGNRKNGLTTRN